MDTSYFGGYVKPANWRENRRDRRLLKNQNGKRRVVVVMRERGGRTLPFVVRHEAQSVKVLERRIRPGSIVHADEARSWVRPITPQPTVQPQEPGSTVSATASFLPRGSSVIMRMKADSTKQMLFVTINGHSPKPMP